MIMATTAATKNTATKKSFTVRLSASTHQKLKELAEQSGESMHVLLDKAVEEYRRHRFFEDLNAAYAALKNDPEAWKEELEERALWEVTLLDGLEDDEP